MNYSLVCRFVKNLWSKGDRYSEPYFLWISQSSILIGDRTAFATTPMFFILTARRLKDRKHFFYPILPDFRKSTPLVEGSLASNVSPAKSNTKYTWAWSTCRTTLTGKMWSSQRKIFPCTTLSTACLARVGLGSNPGSSVEKHAITAWHMAQPVKTSIT